MGAYSLPDLEQAFLAAHKAGDTAAAQALADEIRKQRAAGGGAAQATSAPVAADGGDPLAKRGAILPVGRDQQGNLVLALPDFVAGPIDTIMGIQEGRIDSSNITGKQIFDLGSLFAGSGPRAQKPLTASPSAVSPSAEAARAIGVDLPRGVSVNSPVTRSAVNITGSVPFGGTPLRNAAKTALDQLGIAYGDTKAAMGPGVTTTAADVIKARVEKFASGPDSTLGRSYTDKYNAVDALVDPNVTTELSSTLQVANRIDQSRRSAGINSESQAVKTVLDGATRPGGMTYADAKFLRTYLGELLGNPQLLASEKISKGEAKALYASLTKDLETNIEAAGGQPALGKWRLANAEFNRTTAVREKLQEVVGPSGTDAEGSVFNRIMGAAGETGRADIGKLARVRQAVGKDMWGDVASAIVTHLGEKSDQGFDPVKFASGWDRLSPQAKQIIFGTGPEGGKWLQALDDIATVSREGKELKRVAEPSTGGVIKGAIGVGGISAIAGIATSGFGSIMTAAAGILGARVVSNMLAKPEGAAALATFAKAYSRFITEPSVNSAGAIRAAALAAARYVAVDLGLSIYQEGAIADRLANEPAIQERARRKKAMPVTDTRLQT